MLLSPSSILNVVLSYTNLSLSIMQLLSVIFKCKIYYLFNYYFRIFNQFWDSYLSTHSLYYLSFLILKIDQKHIIFIFFQLPRSLPKFLTRLPFFPVLVLTILLVGVQIHTSFEIIADWGIVIKVMCRNCIR